MITLRKVTDQDSDLLFNWRNNPEIYKYFKSPTPVERSEHDDWITKVLNDDSKILLIAESEGRPIGHLRFDRDESFNEISLYLDPSEQGKGFGVELLKVGEEYLKDNKLIDPVKAHVLKDNKASLKCFEKAGYKEVYFNSEKGVYLLVKDISK